MHEEVGSLLNIIYLEVGREIINVVLVGIQDRRGKLIHRVRCRPGKIFGACVTYTLSNTIFIILSELKYSH